MCFASSACKEQKELAVSTTLVQPIDLQWSSLSVHAKHGASLFTYMPVLRCVAYRFSPSCSRMYTGFLQYANFRQVSTARCVSLLTAVHECNAQQCVQQVKLWQLLFALTNENCNQAAYIHVWQMRMSSRWSPTPGLSSAARQPTNQSLLEHRVDAHAHLSHRRLCFL